ncbi:hypothetical protein EVAR_7204_1 [Eumeta japonica]|uniref:Uncharacterized protein n=1 Tax=Eumeta variegata TaxID=151549 RepID=A0A4C1T555_EUMVA|nr:hypothetical protein EVAR_7204_1 [Eumeta japonica]
MLIVFKINSYINKYHIELVNSPELHEKVNQRYSATAVVVGVTKTKSAGAPRAASGRRPERPRSAQKQRSEEIRFGPSLSKPLRKKTL